MPGFRVVNGFSILGVVFFCMSASSSDLEFVLGSGCLGCHVNTGNLNEIPTLDGYDQEKLFQKMRDYRDGELGGTIMPRLAAGYTDEQLRSLARWLVNDTKSP